MNALDSSNSTSSWNSEGTSGEQETSFTLHFGRHVKLSELRLQFQAGFSAELCNVYADDNTESAIAELELDDVHDVQSHELLMEQSVQKLRLVFEECADFYSRIILYKVEVLGSEVSGTAG